MSDNDARMCGYTKDLFGVSYNGEHDVSLLVRPSTDIDSQFTAWCPAEQEFITVNGWLFTFTEITGELEEWE